ncbi:acyltransferase family protein [Actibacterium sp. 188UL27-1]|uniref:acyltransferase family protein n=1 Tax=Actibacterium sp. 188UL27-1 TaxID=2786961 RepID=UPI0019573633|nr:acyltransferase family protein [Actibacterium sp. 188UL27-1]MBM7067050.1 acyltransferase family protein [Actibacterium sp. 188UL27-1]
MISRLYYLDALRSFCMLFGILLHTGTLQPDSLERIVSAAMSQHFRMPTFFVISGFFAVMMLDKRGLIGFAKHRLVALAVPLVVVLIVLNPITNWLVYVHHVGPIGFMTYLMGNAAPAERDTIWHLHLWFLFTLMVYMVFLPLVERLISWRPVHRAIDWIAHRQGDLLLAIVAVGIIAGELAGRATYSLAFEAWVGGTWADWLVIATLRNAPYFLLGAAAFRVPALFEALHRISWPMLSVGLILVFARPYLPLSGGIDTLALVVSEETLTVAAAAALFAIFRKMLSARTTVVTALNDAVYSIYLLHYFLIYGLAVWVLPGIQPFLWQYTLICLATLAISYGMHRLIIRNVPALRLLLNGKPLPAKPA